MIHFSTKRLFLLIKKTWIENYRIWAIALGVLVAVYIVFHFLTTDRTHIIAFYNRQLIYSFGLIAAGTIFANFIWRDFSTKGQSINFLLLPATPFEKLITAIFYTCIVFPTVYISVFFILDFFYIQAIQSIVTIKIDEWDLHPLSFKDPYSVVLRNTIFFLVLQPIALMSSLLFERFSYIKTALLLFILLFVLTYLFNNIRERILTDTIGDRTLSGGLFNLTEMDVQDARRNVPVYDNIVDTIRLPSSLSYIINLTLTVGTVIFFTFITFLKLKEKEV
ncbi:hypothetical protein [Emticicia fontis]